MSEVWISLKNSLNCKPHSTEVHDPIRHQRTVHRKKHDTSNIKDKHQSGSISQRNSSILNPVTHEILLDSESGEIKICLCCPCPQINEDGKGIVGGNHRSTRRTTSSRKTYLVDCDTCNLFSKPKVSVHKGSNHHGTLTYHGEFCDKQLEEQDMLENSVIQLSQEDSSWQIIERICQTNSNINSERLGPQIQCVLKVQNTQKTFGFFEECREMAMMINAKKQQQNKQPRCLADGNELMRFHGTTIACSLGVTGSSSSNNLCTLDQCGLCQILRHGFSTNQEFHGEFGVLTYSTSEQALDSTSSIGTSNDEILTRKCVIVCRLIAGRVLNPLHEIQETAAADDDDSGFDSLIKKVSSESESDIEELFVLNPRAILPCFVVIYKL